METLFSALCSLQVPHSCTKDSSFLPEPGPMIPSSSTRLAFTVSPRRQLINTPSCTRRSEICLAARTETGQNDSTPKVQYRTVRTATQIHANPRPRPFILLAIPSSPLPSPLSPVHFFLPPRSMMLVSAGSGSLDLLACIPSTCQPCSKGAESCGDHVGHTCSGGRVRYIILRMCVPSAGN